MPTYDYKCENCKHQFEIYQSMKDEKLTTCPDCGKNALRRLIGSGSGLIFKGSGFYLTDYKNKTSDSAVNTTTGSASESKNSESTEPKGEAAKTESKPATTSDSTGSPEKKSSDTKNENKSSTKQETKSAKKNDDK
ncbi:MAG: zinc ribbon domain-containing protein [bacterium]